MKKVLFIFFVLFLSIPQAIYSGPLSGWRLVIGTAESSVGEKINVNSAATNEVPDYANSITYLRVTLNRYIPLGRYFFINTGLTYSNYQIQNHMRYTRPADNPTNYVNLGNTTLTNSAYYATAYATVGARLPRVLFRPSVFIGPKVDKLVYSDIEWSGTYYEELRPYNAGVIGGVSADLSRILPWNAYVEAVYEANLLPAYALNSDIDGYSIWHSTLTFGFGIGF